MGGGGVGVGGNYRPTVVFLLGVQRREPSVRRCRLQSELAVMMSAGAFPLTTKVLV